MSAVAERVGSPPERRDETRYTTSRDPEIDLQVGALLRHATAAVVAELHPDAVVLHGDLGRGEGRAYRADRCVVVMSHIELMAVYRGPLSLLRALGARRHAAALGKRLGRFCGTTVTLTTQAALFLRWPAHSLRSFLMLRSARRLYGRVRFPPPWRQGIERVRPTEFAREVIASRCGHGTGASVDHRRGRPTA